MLGLFRRLLTSFAHAGFCCAKSSQSGAATLSEAGRCGLRYPRRLRDRMQQRVGKRERRCHRALPFVPFVNASSIYDGKVRWAGTQIVNVFDKNGKVVKLSKFPRMAAYLRKNKKKLRRVQRPVNRRCGGAQSIACIPIGMHRQNCLLSMCRRYPSSVLIRPAFAPVAASIRSKVTNGR